MTAQTADVKAQGRRVRSSAPFKALSRSGLAARGVIYILVGSLAVQIALGGGGKEADRQGALQTVAQTPGGTILLWLLAIGLLGMTLWRLSEAIYGQPTQDGDKATKRLSSLARAVFYGVVCSSTVAFIIGERRPRLQRQEVQGLHRQGHARHPARPLAGAASPGSASSPAASASRWPPRRPSSRRSSTPTR